MSKQFIYEFSAENGLRVRVRSLRPTDAPHLMDIFENMSADSRYLRFNVPLNDPDPDWVRQQAEKLSYVRLYEGRAWLAFADLPKQREMAVAGIRYVAVSLEAAEVSLVVRDDLQGLGIGTELLTFAGRKAYADGYRKLVGVVQSMNFPLWQSLRHLGVPFTRRSDGSSTIVEVDLEEAAVFNWHRPQNEANNH